jgi:hypothetical protein
MKYDCAGPGGTDALIANRKNNMPARKKSLPGIEPLVWTKGMKSRNASSLGQRDAKN